MNIELRLLKDIIPYAKNLRKIPQKGIDKVALSITEFGPRQPIVVDGAGVIIVGTVRYLAAKKLGLESFPVHVAEGLTPAQVQGYRISDNRSHEETDWDLDIVKLEINELDALSFDLKFTGFEPRNRRGKSVINELTDRFRPPLHRYPAHRWLPDVTQLFVARVVQAFEHFPTEHLRE